MSALYRDSDLLLVPTRAEGFGIVFVEAAAHGLPSMSYNSGTGVNNAIRHGETGVLLPLGSGPAAFADEIRAWYRDPGRLRPAGDRRAYLLPNGGQLAPCHRTAGASHRDQTVGCEILMRVLYESQLVDPTLPSRARGPSHVMFQGAEPGRRRLCASSGRRRLLPGDWKRWRAGSTAASPAGATYDFR